MDPWSRKFLHLTVTAVVCFGAVATLLSLVAADASRSNLPVLLFLCGCVGAVVANYQRLTKLSLEKEKMSDEISNFMVTIQLYVSPLIGGVLALVLWAAFFSGLVQGDFFPRIDGTDAHYNNFHDLMAKTGPCGFKDAMKGVFWCFLAGYSERFVPNILDHLADKASKGR
jgi:hypothetical protein